ncbi:MAG: hypothetical protein K9G11_04440 [Rickettsiaceae bacterium]|nr:hypothetical protein [Rickettsiaceae bacterium]
MRNIFKVLFLLCLASATFAIASNVTNNNKINITDNKDKPSSNNVPAQKVNTDNNPEYKLIQNEYREELKKIYPEIETELVKYRKKEAAFNKSKNMLFNKLSKEAQTALKKDSDFKKLLQSTKYKLPQNHEKEELDLYLKALQVHEKAVKDYQLFIGSMDPKINKEIEIYRVAVKDINKQKINNYKQLSAATKAFLAKEQTFKKRLKLSKKNAQANKDSTTTPAAKDSTDNTAAKDSTTTPSEENLENVIAPAND